MLKNDLNLNHVTTYVLKGKKHENPRELRAYYDQAFKAWHETWENTYKNDFHSDSALYSDEFTRQDEIVALFYKGECASLCFFSHINMQDESANLDSYFDCWSVEARSALCEYGTQVIICSQFTVIEKFRKAGPPEIDNVPWKMLLTGISMKYFLHSKKDGMTGTMRVNKGMGKLTQQFGALPLIENLEYEAGTEKTLVDLVAFYQDNVYKAYYAFPFASKLDTIWESRNARRMIKLAA